MTYSTNKTPQVWIGCLASYNAGTLHGRWIDIDTDEDSINEEIAEMLKESPEPNAEEFHLCDIDNVPSGLLDRYSSVAEMARVGELLKEYGSDAVQAASDLSTDDLDNLETTLRNGFGVYEDAEDYGYQIAEGYGDLGPLEHYIDFKRYGESILCDVPHTYHNGSLYVFYC